MNQGKNTLQETPMYPLSINPRRVVRAIVYETSVKERKKASGKFLCLGLQDIIIKFEHLLNCKNKTGSCN